VLWVSPPLGWRNAISIKYRGVSSRGVKKISSQFWTYTPERYLPITRIGGLSYILDALRIKKIKTLLHEMGINRLILYVWKPSYASYIGKFNEDLICYHIDDEYTFSTVDLPISEEESKLLKKSDIVFIHSKSLLMKKGELNSATYYVPNGVDFDHYRRIVEDGQSHFDELDPIPKPRIGYVGYIKSQIDLKLLLGIARKRKDWSLVLVGPINESHYNIQKDIELLRRESNVHFLGGKKPEDLPHFIKGMDACLMCYHKNSYTDYIYPMKLHEYLACGKPVIATPLENLKEFRNVLYFAEGLEDWIENIQQALDNSDHQMEMKRIAIARDNSWDSRVETILSVFQKKSF
jgi:glycosyltransferase involved in cell wall biosynthesis